MCHGSLQYGNEDPQQWLDLSAVYWAGGTGREQGPARHEGTVVSAQLLL